MKLACELGYSTILPALRALLILELLNIGVPYSRASSLIGVSTTTVAKYRSKVNHDKLITKIRNDEEIMEDVRALARLVKNGGGSYHHLCELCYLVRKKFFSEVGNCVNDDDSSTPY